MSLNDSRYANYRISDRKIKSQIRNIVKNKIHAVTEKNSAFIDFKTINDIMSSRHLSKNLELSP